MRGYNRDDVEEFRELVIATLEEHVAHGNRLGERIRELEAMVERYRESEELVKNSVVLAQRTSDEIIASAHKEADAIVRQAHAEGDRIRNELLELKNQREQFEYAFYGLLTGFKQRLEQSNPALTGQRQPAAASNQEAATPAAGATPEPRAASHTRPADEQAVRRPIRQPFQPSPATEGKERDADISDFSAALEQADEPATEHRPDRLEPPFPSHDTPGGEE
jgi:cell division initiation protein